MLRLLPEGQAMPECPLSTSDGVKAIDVAWLSTMRQEHEDLVRLQLLWVSAWVSGQSCSGHGPVYIIDLKSCHDWLSFLQPS